MFTNVNVLPLPLRRVVLVVASTHSVAQQSQTRAGKALKRLAFDQRLKTQATAQVLPDKLDDFSREIWWSAAKGLLEPRGSLDGIVWMRSDVVIEDVFLLDRLAEAWTVHQSLVVRDTAGVPVLWALSRKGLSHWLATGPETDAKASFTKLCQSMQGNFPQTELGNAQSAGQVHAPWSLAVALDDTAEKTAEIPATFRGARTLASSNRPSGDLPGLLVVCATRESAARFTTHTATGQSVARMRAAGVDIRVSVSCDNKTSLARVYNRAIDREHAQRIALFVHDDVWIDDVWLLQRLHEGLLRYDVLGVAGNRQCVPNQPSWGFAKKVGDWDLSSNLLGCVPHELTDSKTRGKKETVSVYGPRRGAARLLDGVLLAARVGVLLQSGVRFDERFMFHFYDLDFCRTAEAHGLRMGVWPLAITHQSGGQFKGPDWYASYGTYVGKWQD